MEKMNENSGFSWMGLLFGGAYYAGYGQLTKGLIMAVISFIPITAIPVNIYAGLKAKKQLPVGEEAFEWPKAVLAFFVPVVLGGAVMFFAQGGTSPYTETNFRAEVSSYWTVESSGAELGFDMHQYPYAFIINGQRTPMEIVRFTPEDEDGVCVMVLRLSNGKLFSLTKASHNREFMIFSATGSESDTLRFSREL